MNWASKVSERILAGFEALSYFFLFRLSRRRMHWSFPLYWISYFVSGHFVWMYVQFKVQLIYWYSLLLAGCSTSTVVSHKKRCVCFDLWPFYQKRYIVSLTLRSMFVLLPERYSSDIDSNDSILGFLYPRNNLTLFWHYPCCIMWSYHESYWEDLAQRLASNTRLLAHHWTFTEFHLVHLGWCGMDYTRIFIINRRQCSQLWWYGLGLSPPPIWVGYIDTLHSNLCILPHNVQYGSWPKLGEYQIFC